VHDLKRQGWTNREIAAELGFHPATIAKWLRTDGPPVRPVVPDEARVMTVRWQARLAALLGAHPRLLAVSVHTSWRRRASAGRVRRWCGRCGRSPGPGSGRR
jgi:IS30 family transposase